MKKSDLSVVTVLYAIGISFLIMTLNLPEDAQTYPLVLISSLLGMNTLYLGIALYRYHYERRLHDDISVTFAGFQWRQFALVVVGCFGYLVLMYFLGYYIASIAYMAFAMLCLNVPKKHIVISMVFLMLLVYAVFSLFLKVPLPVGLFLR